MEWDGVAPPTMLKHTPTYKLFYLRSKLFLREQILRDKRRSYDRSNRNLLRACRKTEVSTKICLSKIIWKLLRLLLQLLLSYQPCGCYLRQIIDAERVCKPACKRAEEDCSTSVTLCVTRCVAPSINQSAEA